MIARVLPVILLLISLGLFFGYVNPVYTQKVLPLQAEIQQYNSTLAAASDFNKKEVQLAADRDAIPAVGIARLETYLPDGVDNVQLILDLNALAAKSGIQLSNFDIKSNQGTISNGSNQLPLEGQNQVVDSIDLNVKAVGTYSGFRTFLEGVEQSLRPMDLVQTSLTYAPSGVYNYEMTFRIYWLH